MAKSILLTAMAGAMGWGIRGRYGHETGAMIAGVLVSLVLVFLHCPQTASLRAARAVAFGTIAMGIGGSMTYGQTIGLTQNPEVIGWAAWRWGMLGLGIKGAIWIGFAGLFLGMALGGQRYSGRDVFRLTQGDRRSRRIRDRNGTRISRHNGTRISRRNEARISRSDGTRITRSHFWRRLAALARVDARFGSWLAAHRW
jgi:hypothetical protein